MHKCSYKYQECVLLSLFLQMPWWQFLAHKTAWFADMVGMCAAPFSSAQLQGQCACQEPAMVHRVHHKCIMNGRPQQRCNTEESECNSGLTSPGAGQASQWLYTTFTWYWAKQGCLRQGQSRNIVPSHSEPTSHGTLQHQWWRG